MYLEEINSKEYESFLESTTRRYFYNQTNAAIEADCSAHKSALRIGLKSGNTLVGVAKITQLRFKKIFLSQELHFGPILDYDQASIPDFIQAWQKYAAKNRKVIRLRLTPPADYFAIINENTVKTVFPAESNKVLNELKQLGFIRLSGDFYDNPTIQPRFHYVKDISEVASTMEAIPAKSQRFFAKAERLGIKVRYLADEEIDILDGFLKKTMTKHDIGNTHIRLHNGKSLNTYGANRILPLAYIDAPTTTNILKKTEQDLLTEKEVLVSSPENKKRNRKLENVTELLEATKNRINELDSLGKENHEIPIAAGEFYFTPSDAVYLASGTDDHFRYYNGIYAVHTAMMQEAIKRGCKYYNLFGISDPRKEQGGLLDFKNKFGGEVHEYLGTFEKFMGIGKILAPLLRR